MNLGKPGVNSRVGAHIKVENNYFEDSKDVLGTFYTNELGYWQVAGNIYDNVTWSSDGDENHPAGPDPQSNTTVDIPYSYKLDPAACVPDIVGQTAGSRQGPAGIGRRLHAAEPATDQPHTAVERRRLPVDALPTRRNQPQHRGLPDGSSKADGTGYGNVRDGDMSTYWSPDGSTGRISIKWGSATTVSTINIREAAGSEGHIGSWEVVDHDTGTVLTTGSGAGVITFTPTTLSKIDFVVSGSTGTPRVAEFETYADSTTQPPPTCGPTGPPPTDPPASGALYVAPGGSDGASGTESDPTTLSSAIGRVGSGGTIYMRGGTYHYSQPITIAAGNDGTSGGRTVLSAYPGETPMLDFSGESESSSNRGLQLFGSYWHLYGLVVENAGDNGIAIGGSDNTIERVETRFNADTGIQLSRTASDTPRASGRRTTW